MTFRQMMTSWTRFIITTVITFWISISVQPTLPLIDTVWGHFMERLLIIYYGDPGFQEFYSLFSCGSVNWGLQSQFLWTAAQPDLDFDFACLINFFSTKLSALNMVPTQRIYGNILRPRKADAFVSAKWILRKNFLKFVFTDVHWWPLILNSLWI